MNLTEIPYLNNCFTYLNIFLSIRLFCHPTLWKYVKWEYNHAYFHFNKIVNSIWFFYFTAQNSSPYEDMGKKISQIVPKVLLPKNVGNRNIHFQAPDTENISTLVIRLTFTENIRQPARYINEIYNCVKNW